VKTTAVSILSRPHDRLADRELEVGTEPLRKSVRQDEDDRGERDDRLISKEAEELKRLCKESAGPEAHQLD
jgi:transposase